MSDIERIGTERRASRAVVYNGIVFLAGATAEDRSQDVRGQTRQALAAHFGEHDRRFRHRDRSGLLRRCARAIVGLQFEPLVGGLLFCWLMVSASLSAAPGCVARTTRLARALPGTATRHDAGPDFCRPRS